MLIEVDKKRFRDHFAKDPHPFISIPFTELNQQKVEKVVYLVENKSNKIAIGLVAGIDKGVLLSPFSAPFGGFHFRQNKIYVREIENFLNLLKNYIVESQLLKVKIVLPPNIYNQSFNAKMINTCIRNGFTMNVPEITNYVDLKTFSEVFTDRDARTYYNQAVRNELSFAEVNNLEEKEQVFNLICKNREKFGRPIYMTFKDVLNTNTLWTTDFFKITDKNNEMVASAIFYRAHPTISYAVFWGDSEQGRPLRAMDFLAFNLWNYYKSLNFDFIDMGTSTESGVPNEGLLRFKETHDCISSLRFSFEWSAQ